MQNKLLKTTVFTASFVLVFAFQNCAEPFVANQTFLIDDSSGGGSIAPVSSSQALKEPKAFGESGLRRMTRYELTNSVTDIFGVAPSTSIDVIPSDTATTIYFDNEYGVQALSSSVIDSYSKFAESYAARVMASGSGFNSSNFSGCIPKSQSDRDCFSKLASKLGRLLLRRNFAATEVARYADELLLYATADNRFDSAVELLVSALLQHPEFLYRIEAGSPAPNDPLLVKLNDYEVATRISFFLWGSSPDAALLDAAEAGLLRSESGRLAEAERMMKDSRASRHFRRFHGEWLGYAKITLDPKLDKDLRQESDSLVDRIVLEKNRDWMNIFNFDETYLTPALASHYAMGAITAPQWVKYSGKRGGGILSHGAFLALGSKFADTSPTLRGYEIYKRVMCGKLGQIPDGVDTDNPPGSPGQCKEQRYFMRNVSTCATCHTITDNIGFGLENLSPLGQWRDTDSGQSQCVIKGDGVVDGLAYSGPKELGQLISKSPATAACATRQLFRFMSGREESDEDEKTLEALSGQYYESRSLSSIILAMVKSPAIMHKVGAVP